MTRAAQVLLLLGVLFISNLSLQAAENAAMFDQANKLYEQGKFKDAATAYEQLIQSGFGSATVYYNLGNAWYKAGVNGRAIAAYRQAQNLAPRDPNLRFNLEFVRKKVTGFETARIPLWERFLTTLTVNEWTMLTVCAYWLWFVLLALREFRPALKKTLGGYTATAGVATLLLTACLVAAASQRTRTVEAVVVVQNAVVRRGPLDESPVFYQVPDGSEMTVLDQKELSAGDKKQSWLQVQDSAHRIGWLQRDQVIVLGAKKA